MLALAAQAPLDPPPALAEMSAASLKLLSDALSALSNEDADLSRRIRRADKRVDDLHKEVFAWVHQEIPRHLECTQAAIDVLSIARALERIGDSATNIAEDVIFLIEGAVVRHSSV